MVDEIRPMLMWNSIYQQNPYQITRVLLGFVCLRYLRFPHSEWKDGKASKARTLKDSPRGLCQCIIVGCAGWRIGIAIKVLAPKTSRKVLEHRLLLPKSGRPHRRQRNSWMSCNGAASRTWCRPMKRFSLWRSFTTPRVTVGYSYRLKQPSTRKELKRKKRKDAVPEKCGFGRT